MQNGFSRPRLQLLRNVPPRKRFLASNRDLVPTDRAIQIGFIGRLSPEKGLLFLIEAFDKLKMDHSIHLHIVGDGPEKPKILDRIKQLELEELVTLHGFVPNPQTVYQMLDLLILPSLTEGIPLTLLEGMSLGIPVIASDVGGIPEIIEDNKSGLLVKPGSVDDLINKITLLIKEPSLRKKLAGGAKDRISSICNYDNWKQTLLNIYEELGGNSHD
jgi:glycosyltransferase involved in cell wall biosynthesis